MTPSFSLIIPFPSYKIFHTSYNNFIIYMINNISEKTITAI